MTPIRDEQLRQAITAVEGVELVDEDYEDVVDVVLMWFREEDGDLVDALVDALTPLADGGYIWLLTPKAGRPGHVEPSDIGEAAPTAGLAQTSSVSAARDWSARAWWRPRRAVAPGGAPTVKTSHGTDRASFPFGGRLRLAAAGAGLSLAPPPI